MSEQGINVSDNACAVATFVGKDGAEYFYQVWRPNLAVRILTDEEAKKYEERDRLASAKENAQDSDTSPV